MFGRMLVAVGGIDVESGSLGAIASRADVEGGKLYDSYHSTFSVYDFDANLNKLSDPKVTEPLIKIEPGQVNGQLIGDNIMYGWKPDSHVVQRAGEWARAIVNIEEDPSEFSKKSSEIKKYIQLRRAVLEGMNALGFGIYTYEGIKKEVIEGHPVNYGGAELTNPDLPKVLHRFTQEDLEWLETFMKNSGIPIPGKD